MDMKLLQAFIFIILV